MSVNCLFAVRLAGSEADGVEDGTEGAPVAAHGVLDGGFELLDFVPALGLAGGEGRGGVRSGGVAVALRWMVRIP